MEAEVVRCRKDEALRWEGENDSTEEGGRGSQMKRGRDFRQGGRTGER